MSVQEAEPKEPPGEEQVYSVAAGLLGVKGKKARPKSRLEIHEFLLSGLSGKAVTSLRRHCHILVLEETVEPALGMSLRTVQRFEADQDKHLSSEQSSRAWKFAEIVARATTVFGSQDAAEKWLSEPARAFEGKKPIELLATQPGTQLVEDLLQQIDYGVYV
ncbi:putative toxin-antitoxin system antitoxin component, TIGR02293 family [Rhodospirillales bacterium URHD0017]|nr:putative toxin-antitoxin system antitoxin component, TIGR02293 family [Rhodospirillales bacterium URHD0017]